MSNPGIANLVKLTEQVYAEESVLPSKARRALDVLMRRLAELTEEIETLDRELNNWHMNNEVSRKLGSNRAVTTKSPRSTSGLSETEESCLCESAVCVQEYHFRSRPQTASALRRL